MERAADPSLHCTPSPCPENRLWPGDPHESGPTGEVRTDGHSPTPASSFVCCGGALTGRWELGAGRVGEGRSRQRPPGACGHGLSYPCAGFAPLGTSSWCQEGTGLGGCSRCWKPAALALSHPGLSFPPMALVPTMMNTPATAWVWHWMFLGHPDSSGSATLCSSWAPHLALSHLPPATKTAGAQQVPLTTACLPPGSPKRPRGTGEGWGCPGARVGSG